MPRITRRQCGCNCANRATWTPEGEFLPPCNCSQCGGDNPCEYLVDFGCEVECDGLTTYVGDGGTINTRHVLSLPKDDCLFENACVYSLKTSSVAMTNTVAALWQAHIIGVKGECTSSLWTKFFGFLGSILSGNYAIPAFGCTRSDYNGSVDQPCGWYDLIGLDCEDRDEWTEWLADPATFNRWELTIAGTTATLVGITDSFETITYSTDEWECPTVAADPPIRNTLKITEYPDTLTGCQKFPKAVCVMPGYTNYVSPCTTAQQACNCCDAGTLQACFQFSSASCGTNTITIQTTRNNTLPTGIADPGAPCGYYWGCGAWCAGQICLLIWCDGSGYQVSVYCLFGGVYTLICTTTATLTRCCPDWQITFSCEGSDFSDCCCVIPDPCTNCGGCGCDVPANLFATFTFAACGDLDGKVVDLTYDPSSPPGGDYWRGQISGGACDGLYVTLYLVACIWVLHIGTTTSPDDNCLSFAGSFISCPFTSVSFSPTWNNGTCGCCPSGGFTVDITP